MKKLSFIVVVAAGLALASCSDVRREPGTVYMPDMAYSRAYETYAERDSSVFTANAGRTDDRIFYDNTPVKGTIARGQELPFPIPMDAPGDTVNYIASKQVPNPLPPLDEAQMKEAERLYLINCAICHGAKLDGNGPLYKDGNGPYAAKPATLVGDAKYENMPEGQMYYSIAYGKNLMGSYAAQLSRDQRWMIIHYIKAKQGKSKPAAAPADSTAVAQIR